MNLSHSRQFPRLDSATKFWCSVSVVGQEVLVLGGRCDDGKTHLDSMESMALQVTGRHSPQPKNGGGGGGGCDSRNEDDLKRLDREYESSSRAWKATVPESIAELAPSFLVSTTHNFDADRELGRGTFFAKDWIPNVDSCLPSRNMQNQLSRTTRGPTRCIGNSSRKFRYVNQPQKVRIYVLCWDNDRLLANPDQGARSHRNCIRTSVRIRHDNSVRCYCMPEDNRF